MTFPPELGSLSLRLRRGPGGCWLWTGATVKGGYGELKLGGRVVYVHRLAWQLLRGPLEQGLDLHHRVTCPKHCANPDHLEPLTPTEHRRRHRRSHCKKGHPLDEANTYEKPSGERRCRLCHREGEAARRRRKAEVANA